MIMHIKHGENQMKITPLIFDKSDNENLNLTIRVYVYYYK